MLVASERLGDFEVEDDRILAFPDGLLGFQGAQRFAMVEGDDNGTYYWLQSVDDPSLAFLSVVPWAFFPDYAIELGDTDEQSLGLTSAADALVLCLLTVHRESGQITANLLGPLVVNASSRVGRQLVLADSGYPVKAPLVA